MKANESTVKPSNYLNPELSMHDVLAHKESRETSVRPPGEIICKSWQEEYMNVREWLEIKIQVVCVGPRRERRRK
jgi:hypothetical protein